MCLIPGWQAAGCGMLVMQTATEDGVCHHRCEQQQIGQPWKHGSSRGAEGLTGEYKMSAVYRQELAGGRKFCQEILISSVFDRRDFELKRGFAAKPSIFLVPLSLRCAT